MKSPEISGRRPPPDQAPGLARLHHALKSEIGLLPLDELLLLIERRLGDPGLRGITYDYAERVLPVLQAALPGDPLPGRIMAQWRQWTHGQPVNAEWITAQTDRLRARVVSAAPTDLWLQWPEPGLGVLIAVGTLRAVALRWDTLVMARATADLVRHTFRAACANGTFSVCRHKGYQQAYDAELAWQTHHARSLLARYHPS
ncbi:MAG: hypothetical protein GYB64_00030 [Chloroflexi bacterium]|nr:hypothetical protein [Chloroflexota bacterium]